MDGIDVLGGARTGYPGVSVRDGTILGMGHSHVLLEDDAIVSDLRVRRCGEVATSVGSAAIPTADRVADSLPGGIDAVSPSRIVRSRA